LSRDIDGAARDVEAAINAARTYLPANLPANPTYRKVNPADSPIMILGLTSDKYDKPTLYDEASSVIAQKLSQIAGRGAGVGGRRRRPFRARGSKPHLLNSHGLTLQNIQSVLSQQNAHEPAGQISDGTTTADIVTNDQISHADQFKPLIVGSNKGAAIRLVDVADVSNGCRTFARQAT
jgi:multidrug efflux pump